MKRVLSVLLAVLLLSVVLPVSTVAADGCTSIKEVYCRGTGEQWEKISMGPSNEELINATIHFSSTEPDMPAQTPTPAPIPTPDPDEFIIRDGVLVACFAFDDVTIPNEVKEIAPRAFPGYTQDGRIITITSIQIHANVLTIQEGAFHLANGLKDIIVDKANPNYSSLDGVLFNKDQTRLIYCAPHNMGNLPPEGRRAYDIPYGVTSIGKYAFASLSHGGTRLNSIFIPNSVTSIDDYAFENVNSRCSVVFCGTEDQWKWVSIGKGNERLTSGYIQFSPEYAPDYTPEPTPTPEPTEEPTPTPEPTEEPTPTPEPTPAPPAFTDVGERDWFAVSVAWAVQNNITSGKGSSSTFKPHDTCTRAEIMTFIWASEGRPAPSAPADFVDMPSLPAFRSAISWAVEQGVTSGMGGGKFGATMPCTRVQAVTFLWAAAGRPQPTATAAFSDMTGNSVYDAAISWAVENRITTGAGNNRFNPGKRCSRAEIVTFLRAASAEKS